MKNKTSASVLNFALSRRCRLDLAPERVRRESKSIAGVLSKGNVEVDGSQLAKEKRREKSFDTWMSSNAFLLFSVVSDTSSVLETNPEYKTKKTS